MRDYFLSEISNGHESVSICLEQGGTAVFNIVHLFVISNEHYIVVFIGIS